ncbi:peptidase A4 family-domain-containing protein [Mycena capillaripes]|nr:peptidase A4 family-domain-containing protein [Mycena capillaripes]
MLFSTLLVQVLVAAGTLATPSLDKRSQSRIARREEFIRRVAPPGGSRVPFPTSNWAGAVITDPTARWKSVAGEVVIPSFNATVGLRAAYISIWVGVDGFTCNSATIKVGVDIEVNKTGGVTYTAWDEYFPDQCFAEPPFIPFAAGDNVTLIAIANNFNEQDAEIIDSTAHSAFDRTFKIGPVLCQSDAIWGIETWQVGDVKMPFNVEFTSSMATRLDGTVVGPGNATIINKEENEAVLSNCSTTESTVTCSFLQP